MASVAGKSTTNVATKAVKQRVLQKSVKAKTKKTIGSTLTERETLPLPEASKSLEKAELSTTRGRVVAGVIGSVFSETVI